MLSVRSALFSFCPMIFRPALKACVILHKLADYYGVSIDYLLGRTKSKEPYKK